MQNGRSLASEVVVQDGGEMYAQKESVQGPRNEIAWPD